MLLGPKLLHYITLLFRINFPNYVIIVYRIGFELFPWLYNFLCCFKAHCVDIGLHYMIVFELTYRLCNLFLHYRIGFEFRPPW